MLLDAKSSWLKPFHGRCRPKIANLNPGAAEAAIVIRDNIGPRPGSALGAYFVSQSYRFEMTFEDLMKADTREKLEELLTSDVYRENIDFWERAWAGVKTAYTQLPDLEYLQRIPETLRNRSASSILDLGCGTGWLAVYLGRAGFNVTGLDVSRQAIKLAREWADKEELDIHFEVGDIAELPYPDGAFDAVVANSIMEHFPLEVTASTINHLKTILIPGGTFIGCFDKVGGGPGEYYELPDKTHVYTDKGRKGMLLRYYSDDELQQIFKGWRIECMDVLESGTRFVVALT